MMKPSNIVVDGDMARVELLRRDGPSLWTVVDARDVALISEYRWVAQDAVTSPTFYAASRVYYDGLRPAKKFYMHRVIAGTTGHSIEVDHNDGDGLNNRRANLVVGDRAANQQNRRSPRKGSKSGVRGVSWSAKNQKWVVKFMQNRRYIRLGRFRTIEEASAAIKTCGLYPADKGSVVHGLHDADNCNGVGVSDMPRPGINVTESGVE